MVAVLRDQHMRQQPGAGHASGNGSAWRSSLNNDIANRTSELRANVLDDPETRRHVLKHFCDIFTEFLQRTATVRAATLYRQMLYRFTGQMIRQGLAFWFGPYGRF